MARPLRLEFAHGLYHVTSRGDGQKDIYRDDADRELFLVVLSETVDRCNWVIHAYCLMGNHYHQSAICFFSNAFSSRLCPCINAAGCNRILEFRGLAK